MITQPRMPCYKLGIQFQMNEMIKLFLDNRWSGFFVAVTREGEVGAGDEITKLGQAQASVSIPEIVRLYVAKSYSSDEVRLVKRAIAVDALPESWKKYFREKLNRLNS